MPAANAAALLRRNASDPDRADRPALRSEDRVWTHRDYVVECARWANLFLARRMEDRPFHVALMLDNIPEYLFAFGGAALAGATIVGLNHTRRGPALLRDIQHTHCQLLISEPRHAELIDPLRDPCGIDPENQLVVGESLSSALAACPSTDPGVDPDPDSRWALIFTSGTSDAPKAVICTQRRIMVTSVRMSMLMQLTASDVGYVCMPLFHSNSVMCGWGPSLVTGASIGLARRFSASGWLSDVRRYGATWFNYTGKPLAYIMATPERPDDGDNPLRVAYGNEGSPQVVEAFGRRFDVRVVDAFGATEGGVAVTRVEGAPSGAMGQVGDSVKVVDEDGHELPRARFDEAGRLIDPEGCVGEIVNVAGRGPFEGYYNNDEANARATRFGWYWSGDLGYIDESGFLYFAGRTADWIRVDGENFPSGPIEAVVARHPDVVFSAVYGGFGAWVDGQADLAPKWRPRYVRVTEVMPSTPTNKILKRTLVSEKFRSDRTGGDPLWMRDRDAAEYRPFTAGDEEALRRALVDAGRERFWDL
jgi:fatty-acyl-CoA synthase